MKRFAYKLLLFAAIFFIYDKLFFIVAERSAAAEVDKRLEYLIRGEINKDIIVLGSSRGARAILAGEIEKQTGFSAYNLCYPGSNVEFHEFLMRVLVKYNDPPKVLLMVVDDDTYFFKSTAGTIIFRKDRLYPLVKYPYIRSEMVSLGEKDRVLSELLVLYRLNKSNFDLRKKQFTPVDTILSCGSMPISWKSRNGEDRYLVNYERDYPIDEEIPEKVDAFKKIVSACDEHNINLIVVFTPIRRAHSNSFEERIRELTGESGAIYVYDRENPAYRDAEYYHDGGHLLNTGAEIFTRELSDYLLKLRGKL